MATAMMEFASPTHTAVMTCEEYAAFRQEQRKRRVKANHGSAGITTP